MSDATVVMAVGTPVTAACPWPTVDRARHLAGRPSVRVEVIEWSGHPASAALAEVAAVWAPSDLEGSPAVRVARALHADRLASVLKDQHFRRRLRRHAGHPLLLDGVAVAGLVPWLRGRSAPTIWLLHPGDVVPPELLGADRGRRPLDQVTQVLVADDAAAAALSRAGRDGGVQVVGDLRLMVRSPRPATFEILGVGPLDTAHGIDLLPRLLWHLDRLRPSATPVRARWWGPGELPPAVAFDLRRLGLDDRVRVERSDDLQPAVDRAGCLVLPWRTGLDPGLVAAAAAAGRPTVGFAAGPPTSGDGAGRADWPTLVPFGDLAAMARAITRCEDPSVGDAVAAEGAIRSRDLMALLGIESTEDWNAF